MGVPPRTTPALAHALPLLPLTPTLRLCPVRERRLSPRGARLCPSGTGLLRVLGVWYLWPLSAPVPFQAVGLAPNQERERERDRESGCCGVCANGQTEGGRSSARPLYENATLKEMTQRSKVKKYRSSRMRMHECERPVLSTLLSPKVKCVQFRLRTYFTQRSKFKTHKDQRPTTLLIHTWRDLGSKEVFSPLCLMLFASLSASQYSV